MALKFCNGRVQLLLVDRTCTKVFFEFLDLAHNP
jgi:hypothetical protein